MATWKSYGSNLQPSTGEPVCYPLHFRVADVGFVPTLGNVVEQVKPYLPLQLIAKLKYFLATHFLEVMLYGD